MATFTQKKIILVIFGKFRKRNPRAVRFFRRILDRNVVVGHCWLDLQWKLVSGIQRGNVFTKLLDVQWIQTRSTARLILAT